MSSATIHVVIVDDEPIARRGIRQLLAPHADMVVAGEARNGREAVRLLTALSPQLVFLDVQMPELDGFAVLQQLQPDHLPPAVIFVTAYDSFAVRAFETNALDYLVKPVAEARFLDALSRARERLRSREALALSRQLSQLLMSSDFAGSLDTRRPANPCRTVIGTSGADLILDTSDIVWIEAEDYYAAVHTTGRRHLVRESLTSLEARLDRSQFVRIHRRAIVNLAHVREVRLAADDESTLLLKDGTKLPLSRRRRSSVKASLRRFVR